MAFPGTYNFTYYKGDTFEFRIYPKDASGGSFDLSGYDPTSGASFTISTTRGAAGFNDQVACVATINTDAGYVLCRIDSSVGVNLDSATQYVYDVEITKDETVGTETINYTYTLLTGNIQIVDQVSGVPDPGV
jgi:hypothetical protein